jgi:hypothetical protein
MRATRLVNAAFLHESALNFYIDRTLALRLPMVKGRIANQVDIVIVRIILAASNV